MRSTALDNVGVDSVDIEYAQTDNAIEAPEEGWSTTAPQWQQGMFVWSRTKTILTDGSILYSNPACITGAKGEMGTAIKYLGLFDHLPENANEGEFILAKSDFTSSENLQLINGNKLKLISGNYLSLLRSYTAGYIYVKSSKDYWWRVDDKNDYRYLLASNDLLEMGWSLSTNLQEELDDIEESAKEYTDSEIESFSQEVDVKVQNAPHYIGPSSAEPQVANIGDWFLDTTAQVLKKYNGSIWNPVPGYNPETAYMYNSAAKDCLALAAEDGNVESYALAFIASLKTYSVEFQDYVASLQNVDVKPGDQSISMGLNPKDSNDPTFNFMIQKCVNKIGNTEIWSKELYTEQNENGNFNLEASGKIHAYNGLTTTGDLWSGSNIEEPNIIFNEEPFSLANYSGGTVYLDGVYYAFQGGAGVVKEIIVWSSADGKNFNKIDITPISVSSIADLVSFKNHIFLATTEGLYEFLPASRSFILKNSTGYIREFCNIQGELLICPIYNNFQLISYDGESFNTGSQKLGYHLSPFSKDLWIGSSQYSNIMSTTNFFTVLRYSNKNFQVVSNIVIPGRQILDNGTPATITSAGQVYAANGCIYAAVRTSERWMLAKSIDCGQSWNKVELPVSVASRFAIAFKGYGYESVIILYSESDILLSYNGGTNWQLLSFGGASSMLPVSPYIVADKNRKTIRIHTADSSYGLKIVDVIQYRAFGTGHGIETSDFGNQDFCVVFSNGFVIQGGTLNRSGNYTFKQQLRKLYSFTANGITGASVQISSTTTTGFSVDGSPGEFSWNCYGLI